MSVNWEWRQDVGSMVLHQFVGENNEEKTFKIGMFGGNCTCALIYRYKQNGEKYYNFIGFFNDITHLKNCLSETYPRTFVQGSLYPTKEQAKKKGEFEEFYSCIKINLYAPSKSQEKERLAMVEAFTKSGHKVTTYYKKY